MSKPANPTILTKKSVAMQRLSDAVNHGYSHYTSGSVGVDRLQRLVRKFDLLYQPFSSRNVRARRKAAKLGNAEFILWLHDGIIYWWLMVTPPQKGEHPAHANEKLQFALGRSGRIALDGFELVLLPRKENKRFPVKSRTHPPKPTRLTWRMTAETYHDWREAIIATVRSRAAYRMHTMLCQLYTYPGFGEIRSQIGKLAALYKAEVKRACISDAPKPPKHLGYIRRLRHDGVSMLQLTSQLKTVQ
ncbi:MAG: hypothetical protein PHH47_11560 [Gallionella sp.]|nr:hypothetical protein [Gallionella sp.]MDD4947392.1 hypothetical protein [Gallionella sp.]